MDQLTGQHTKIKASPTAKLPHKMQESKSKVGKKAAFSNNRDIEAFIASSPVKQAGKKNKTTLLTKNFPIKASPQMMSSNKGSSHKGGGGSTIH